MFQIYLSVKLADSRMSIKKKNNSLLLIYNILSWSKMAEKTETF